MIKYFNGSVRLGMGHSLIVGHGPRLARLEAIKADDKTRSRINSFGFFEVGTPDTSTYYKDVNADDLAPKPDDYVKPIFRALSEVIVRKQYDPIDFGHEKGVLKASMPLLLAQTIFTNHEANVGNEVGVVSQVFWDNGYTDSGISIPAGINFEAMVDGKNNPRLARNLLSDPPAVHSNSVTVNFKWAQSHPAMSYDEFRGKSGTFDDKGQLIRRIVTSINAYHETSFVAHGADPFAQITNKEGKIVNPRYAAARDSFSEQKKVTNYYFSDFKTSITSNSDESFEEEAIPDLSNIIENEDSDSTQTNKFQMKKELVQLLAILAGVTLTAEELAIPDAEFSEKFNVTDFATKLEANKTKLDGLKALADQTAEISRLTTENQTLTKFKTDNEAAIADLSALETEKGVQLAELIRISTIVNGAAPAEALKATYESANLATLKAFLTPLNAQLEEKFPMECSACHSKEVSRASASAEGDGGKDNKTSAQVREQLRDKRKKANNSGFLA